MRTPLLYIPLSLFITGVHRDIVEAAIHAAGQQKEYLLRIAAEKNASALQAIQLAGWLEVDSMSVDVYFATIPRPRPSLFHKLAYSLRLAQRPPEGILLEPATKERSDLSFTIRFDKATRHVVAEPQQREEDQKLNYYVLAKAS